MKIALSIILLAGLLIPVRGCGGLLVIMTGIVVGLVAVWSE